MVKILDSSALIAYFEKESGYEEIAALFSDSLAKQRPLLMSSINWGEVYYFLIREHGLKIAEEILSLIDTFPIELTIPDLQLTKQASVYKATRKLPYVDCFAAALAKLHNGELITRDHDFKVLQDEIKIRWL